MFEITSKSENDTKDIGCKLAPHLKKGDLVILLGDLGAGKTAFLSGILKFYGKEDEAASPTFTIINEHDLPNGLKLFHFDVYRFENEEEFTAIGGEEFFYEGICVIEWADKIKNLLPKEYLKISIDKDENDLNTRFFTFEPIGNKYENMIKEAFNQ